MQGWQQQALWLKTVTDASSCTNGNVNGLSSETLATFDGDDPEANNLNNEKSLSKVQSIFLTKSDCLTKSARFLSPYKHAQRVWKAH